MGAYKQCPSIEQKDVRLQSNEGDVADTVWATHGILQVLMAQDDVLSGHVHEVCASGRTTYPSTWKGGFTTCCTRPENHETVR